MKRPMTPRGYQNLRQDLLRLKSQRPELARAIEVARAHGDLSENAEYAAAKENSGIVEAKIRDIETKLSNAQVLDPKLIKDPERVVFGTSVRIEDVDSGEEKTLTIVGEDESDVARGFISLESPLGRGLVGKEEGDIAEIRLPAGKKEYEIRDIYVSMELFEVEEISESPREQEAKA